MSKDIDLTISSAFKVRKEDVLVALVRLEREVKDGMYSQFAPLQYKKLFSDKVIEFLQNPNVKSLIDDKVQQLV